MRAFGDPFALGALGHTWSLAEEEQFYLLWPLVLCIALRYRRSPATWVAVSLAAGITLWGAILVASGASGFRLDNGPDTRSVGLLVGCAVALNRDALTRLARVSVIPAAAVIAVVATLPFFASTEIYETGALTLFCLACAVLVLVAVDAPPRVLTLKPLAALGTISYSLYLWHLPILIAVGCYGTAGLQGPAWLRASAVALALVIATASYRWVERPLRQPAAFVSTLTRFRALIGQAVPSINVAWPASLRRSEPD